MVMSALGIASIAPGAWMARPQIAQGSVIRLNLSKRGPDDDGERAGGAIPPALSHRYGSGLPPVTP